MSEPFAPVSTKYTTLFVSLMVYELVGISTVSKTAIDSKGTTMELGSEMAKSELVPVTPSLESKKFVAYCFL